MKTLFITSIILIIACYLTGNSLVFDGNDSLISNTTVGIPLGNSPRTFEAWIKLPNITNQHTTILQTWDFLYVNNTGWSMRLDTGNRLWLWGHNHDFWSTGTVPVNTWAHVAISFTGNHYYFWINGTAAGEGSSSSFNTVASQVTIGMGGDAVNFKGNIAAARISNNCRYTTPFTPGVLDLDASTVGLWNFYEGSGSITHDLTSNGNNYSINGAEWSIENPPLQVKISGHVTKSNDEPLPDVVINFSSTPDILATSNMEGYYEVYLPYGYNGSSVPILNGFVFSPLERDYSDVYLHLSNENYIGHSKLISIYPNEVNFGMVYIGYYEEMNLTIENIGLDSLLVTNIDFVNEHTPFSIQNISFPLIVQPGQTQYLPVVFTPHSVGSIIDTLRIYNSSLNNPLVIIDLRGLSDYVPPKSPENLSITLTGIDITLNWDAVTENIYDTPVSVPYYFIYGSNVIDPDPTQLVFLGYSTQTTFIHEGIGLPGSNIQTPRNLFYRVCAVLWYPPRDFVFANVIGMNKKQIEDLLISSIYD